MITDLFYYLELFEDVIWGYLGVPIVVLVGFYFTFKSRFVQIRQFPSIVKLFFSLIGVRDEKGGVHPIKAFFASVGGCVGIGNIVGVCTAVQIGGPGALFWVWITAFVGVMLKYAEVYLGMIHRVKRPDGGYNGGPMYFLQPLFKTKFVPALVSVFLCIYGVEVYQFNVVVSSITTNFDIARPLVVGVLLFLVIYAGLGGVRRVGNISSAIIPFFVIIFSGMGLWVLFANASLIPSMLYDVFRYAFTAHAGIGGFIGSTLMITISQGVRRGCYTGDLGVGYASVIHSESSIQDPKKQAALVLFGVFLDTCIICTISIFIILVTGVWHEPMQAELLVQAALRDYFPYMNYFMPLFLFLLGYSTVTAYLIVGIKCAEFLSPKYGRPIYFAYAILAFVLFSFVDSTHALTLMSVSGGLLLVINSYGIFRLRGQVKYFGQD